MPRKGLTELQREFRLMKVARLKGLDYLNEALHSAEIHAPKQPQATPGDVVHGYTQPRNYSTLRFTLHQIQFERSRTISIDQRVCNIAKVTYVINSRNVVIFLHCMMQRASREGSSLEKRTTNHRASYIPCPKRYMYWTHTQSSTCIYLFGKRFT